MAVDVTERVSFAVTNMTIERDGEKMKVSWAIPPAMTDENRADRAQFLDSIIGFYGPFDTVSGEVWNSASPHYPTGEKTLDYTGFDVNWVKGLMLNTSYEKPYDRNRYYPLTYRTVDDVAASVHGGNASGVGGDDAHSLTALGRGPSASVLYRFNVPDAPRISMTYDQANRKVHVVMECDEGKGNAERYDTVMWAEVKKQDGSWVRYNGEGNTTTRLTKWERDYDLTGYGAANPAEGKTIVLRFKAYSRGMAGDSSVASSDYTVKKPTSTTITKITSAGKKQGSQITVSFNEVAEYGVTVQLQRYVGNDIASASFTDVTGAVDNGGRGLNSLCDVYGNVNPAAGTYTYYRLKITKDNFTTYSEAVRADCIYTAKPPKVCPSLFSIVKTRQQPVASGQTTASAYISMAWTDKFDESDASKRGCELTISESPDAWTSTEAPKVYEFADNASALDSPRASAAYAYSRTVAHTCTQGVTYYARMRRWRTMDGEKVYSDNYSNAVSFKLDDASTAKVGIAGVTPGKDGTTATVIIGINETTENLGTNVSYSTLANAWQSNKSPDSFKASWEREPYNTDNWTYAQDVYLYELSPSTTYFIRAQRYSANTEGNWSPIASFTTPAAPTASSDSSCTIISCEGGDDGKSAVVVIGWEGNRTGCEVSWSDDPNAWESSEQPSTMEATWFDVDYKGGYSLTRDTAVVATKTYYTRSGSGTAADPYVHTVVQSPSTSAISTYYERDWAGTCTVYLGNLTEGTTYYVRARAYHDGDSKTYSEYGETAIVTPISAPKAVVLNAPNAIARGESIDAYWTIEGDLDQAEWHVHPFTTAKVPNKSLASGEGSLCRATIPPERYGTADSVSFYVSAGCGGGLTDSNVVSVGIADAPSCEVGCPSTLTAQPLEFEVYTDDPKATVLATCRSRGISMAGPSKSLDQLDGEPVWTASLAPAWTAATWDDTILRDNLESAASDASDAVDGAVDALALSLSADTEVDPEKVYVSVSGDVRTVVEPVGTEDPSNEGWYEASDATAIAYKNAVIAEDNADAALLAHPSDGEIYVATVTLPTSDFYDSGRYYLEASAVEPIAGLASETAIADFAVDWSHQAPQPSASVALTVDSSKRTVKIKFATPASSATGDCYDLYRQTPTGHVLVASGLALDTEVLDPYAPFGNRHYRVACRTADGDFSFRDYDYALSADVLRFDFDGQAVELPWNLELSDAYAKSYASRDHADGSVNGYFEPAVKMSGTYNTDVAKLTEQGQLAKVRALAEYAGACFCRTAEGMAFQCNADVTGLEMKHGGGASPVRLTVSAMKMTDEFAVQGGRGA